MKYLDRTFATPAENLACDEALLDWCDEDEAGGDEILRFWEPNEPFVVVGYSNKIATEVNLQFCRAASERSLTLASYQARQVERGQPLTPSLSPSDGERVADRPGEGHFDTSYSGGNAQMRPAGIPVYRRCSGGGTVLQAPGVLNYSLILRISEDSPLHTIPGANTHIMQCHRDALAALLGRPVAVCGTTDLARDGLKFSGNAQRRKRRHLLFHGTFLLTADLTLIQQALMLPSRQPDYRASRSHIDFLTNLDLPPDTIKTALRRTWAADQQLEPPLERIRQLARDRYNTDEWNLRC